MTVIPIPAFKDNYIWLIINNEQKTAICVDPGDAKPVIDYVTLYQLNLLATVLTHHHYDHIGGVGDLHMRFPSMRIYAPDDARIPHSTNILLGDSIEHIASYSFKILSTPGHTATHISLYEPHYRWLFCGDTLFSAGCGRVFDGTMEELYNSLLTLKALPLDTKVFCAHEYTRRNLEFAALVEPNNQQIKAYKETLDQSAQCSLPSTIAIERAINPFLRINNQDGIKVFAKLRQDKDNF